MSKSSHNKFLTKNQATPDPTTIEEKMRTAAELRKLQESLSAARAANRAERASKRIHVRIKTR